MDPRARLVAVAVLLAAGGTTAALVSRGAEAPDYLIGPSAAPLPVTCAELPERIATPSWLPEDLPLPAGTYASALPPVAAEGIRQIALTAKAPLDDVVKFMLERWPESGWELGRGEREPGEAEAVFFAKDKERYGQFRARAIYCDQTWTELLLIMVLDGPIPEPASSS